MVGRVRWNAVVAVAGRCQLQSRRSAGWSGSISLQPSLRLSDQGLSKHTFGLSSNRERECSDDDSTYPKSQCPIAAPYLIYPGMRTVYDLDPLNTGLLNVKSRNGLFFSGFSMSRLLRVTLWSGVALGARLAPPLLLPITWVHWMFHSLCFDVV